MNRQVFLKSLLGGAAFAALPRGLAGSELGDALNASIADLKRPASGSMIGYADSPIAQVRIGIVGLGNRGYTLLQMLAHDIEQGNCQITAICDLNADYVSRASTWLSSYQTGKAMEVVGNKDAWEAVAKSDDVDLLLIVTPWEWHTPMAVMAMESGKHVAMEVPAAHTLDHCWELVSVAEKTQRHCIMIENCCYNDEELWVLNMIESGVFGDITHAEGAYLHDLRAHMLSSDYYQDQWRLQHHRVRNGNFYTTHGLGPIAMYLGIGRGDHFEHLTSMSSREKNLSDAFNASSGLDSSEFACGDMNNTLMKTQKGKTVLLQFDVHTARPYSRINKVVGTSAVHDGYPSRLYVDKGELVYWGHKWLSESERAEYQSRYRHPMLEKLDAIKAKYKQGHGGMDFVMMHRLVRCMNLGQPLDLNVYDGALWSAVSPLSEMSVAMHGQRVDVPDFTGGAGDDSRPLEIMREIG